jgi:hypothetical protein
MSKEITTGPESDKIFGLITGFLNLKDIVKLQQLNSYFKHEIVNNRFNHKIQNIWYWENMDNKIIMRITKKFRHVKQLEFLKCKYKLSTMDIRKII